MLKTKIKIEKQYLARRRLIAVIWIGSQIIRNWRNRRSQKRVVNRVGGREKHVVDQFNEEAEKQQSNINHESNFTNATSATNEKCGTRPRAWNGKPKRSCVLWFTHLLSWSRKLTFPAHR
jgi:hypothetical protein